MPEQVHGHDRAGARRDRGLDGGRIEAVGLVLDVGEDRDRADGGDRLGGRVERERGADDLVAGCTPSARSAITSASVPLATPMPCAVPTCSANARSTSATRGPRMKRPESMTSPIARGSARAPRRTANGDPSGARPCPTVATARCEVRASGSAVRLGRPAASCVGGDLGHRDAPGLPAREQLVRVDLVEPAHEVPLVLARRRSEDGLARTPLRLLRALLGRCEPLVESGSFGIPFTHASNTSANGGIPRRARQPAASAAARSSRAPRRPARPRAPRSTRRGRRRQGIHLGQHRVHRPARRRAELRRAWRRQPGRAGRGRPRRPARELERSLGDGLGRELACALLHEPAHGQADDLVGRAVVQTAVGGKHVGDVGGVREALARGRAMRSVSTRMPASTAAARRATAPAPPGPVARGR